MDEHRLELYELASGLVVASAGVGVSSAPSVVLQPGDPWDAAYEAAQWGDVVGLADGHHGHQEILSAKGNRDGLNAHIVFQPVPGAVVTVGDLDLYAPHITVRSVKTVGLSIDGYGNRRGGDLLLEDVDIASGDLTSGWNVTFRRVDFGPNTEGDSSQYPWPQDGYIVNAWPTWDGHHPKNILFEDCVIHDVVEPTSTAHSDGLQFTAGERVTIRGCAFLRCEHADIMVAPDQGPILDFLVEDCYLDRTLSAFYSINAAHKDKGPDKWDRLTFRGNVEAQNVRLDAPGITYTGNRRESMAAHVCSAAKSAGSLVDGNTYRTGSPCGPDDVIDPNLDLSYEAWLAR